MEEWEVLKFNFDYFFLPGHFLQRLPCLNPLQHFDFLSLEFVIMAIKAHDAPQLPLESR
jgi:hypothetical protein